MVHFLSFFAFIATFMGFSPSLVGEWVRYVDPDSQFEVFMPDSTIVQRTPAETPIGVIDYVVVSCVQRQEAGSIQYAVNHCTYPADAVHADSTDLVDALLRETVTSSLDAFGGEMIYQETTTLSGEPGIIWKMTRSAESEKDSDVHMKCKALVVGNTFYCLQVVVPEALTVENEGDRFFNSFKLLRG